MFKLNQDSGKNCFVITDKDGYQVFGTKEELKELCQQIDRIKDELPQKKKDTRIVILENDCTNEKVQMELSDSAYRLLCYLYNEDWFDSYVRFAEFDKTDFERFI